MTVKLYPYNEDAVSERLVSAHLSRGTAQTGAKSSGSLPRVARAADDGTLGSPRSRGGRRHPGRDKKAFRDAFFMLDRRIGLFLSLPLASIDSRALKTELDNIGRQ